MINRFYYKIKLYFILILLLSSCHRKDELVITVAGRKITKADIALVASLNKLQPGTDTSLAVALYQLYTANACMVLADSLKIPVTDSILAGEAARIDANTHLPRRIDSLRIACGDNSTYIKLFVMPQFVKRWLHYNFKWNPLIHKQHGDSAKLLLEALKKHPEPLKAFSKKYLYTFRQYTVDSIDGIMPFTREPAKKESGMKPPAGAMNMPGYATQSFQSTMDEKSRLITSLLIQNVLSKMINNSIYPYPVEMEDAYWLVQLYEWHNKKYFIGVIEIPKSNFFIWLDERIKSIPVKVNDTLVWEKMKEKLNLNI
jgi:hypothetical protein